MFSRVIAALLALVLFSSGLAAQAQAPRCAAPPSDQHLVLALHAGDAAAEGSRCAPHPEGQPAQSLAESPLDLPGLLQVNPRVQAPTLAMARPAPFTLATRRAPYLEAPQRPPCTHNGATHPA